jgi:hypothetical protein
MCFVSPLRSQGAPVEMPKVRILITIGISGFLWQGIFKKSTYGIKHQPNDETINPRVYSAGTGPTRDSYSLNVDLSPVRISSVSAAIFGAFFVMNLRAIPDLRSFIDIVLAASV